jgi:capsular exopolysaccharide synthesis family protein
LALKRVNMSQIFEALLRSEAERTGSRPVMQTEATELLQSVEHGAASRWASSAPLDRSDTAAEGERDVLHERELVPTHAEILAAAGLSRNHLPAEPSDIWAQFQSLSVAPHSEGRLTSLTGEGNPTAEAFRLLGVRLRDLRQVRPLKKLLITSTVPREGKSTVAANIACTLATKAGEKVLLLEGDVRRPTLSGIFNLGNLSGLCELLTGEVNLPESIYRLDGAGIWILPAGSSPATPLELLQSKRLPALMDQLASLFDWIIVDSPPVLPLADTSVWTRTVDGILLVTRQGVTEKQQLRRGLQALDQAKLIGALQNCSKISTYSDYYYNPSTASKATVS